jgi:phage-related protein
VDDLEEVTQKFTADMAEYEANIEEGATFAQEFATANEEVTIALDGVRDSAAEAGAAVGHVRDDALEAAAGMTAFKDAQNGARDSSGELAAGAEAEALALGHLRDDALEAAVAVRGLKDEQGSASRSGMLSGLTGLFGGGGGGGGGSAGAGAAGIPLLGSLSDALPVVAALLPLIMAALAEVGALATGLTAAGLGVGGFAALALPAFKSVTTAYSQINTDQQAYNRALTATARNTALAHLKQDYANLSPAQRGAVEGLQDLVAEYHKLSKAFEPTAFKVFNEGLKIANQLLPYVGQFAAAAAPAIEGLLSTISKAIAGPEFKYFMDFLSSLAGPVITAIGSGMSGLAKEVMFLMERFSKKDVINAVNIAFRILGFTIQLVTGLIMEGMIAWDWITQKALPAVRSAFDTTRHAIATAGHDIAHAFDTVRHDIAIAGHDIAVAFDTVRHAAATVGHDIVTGLSTAANWISSHWKEVLAWLDDPIGMAVHEIKTHTHQIATAFDDMRHLTANILAGWRHDIASAFDTVRHDIAALADWVPHEIAHLWDEARHDTASGLDNIRHDIASAFDGMRHNIASWIDDVLHFFEKLPGQLVNFLKSLPGQMLNIGENVIKGLINGILNEAAQIPSIMKGLASDVASYFTDPLKLFSPSRLFFEHGYNIVQGAINGVKANAPNLLATMRGLGTGVAGTGSSLAAGAIAPASGSTSMHVTVPVTVQGSAAATASPQYLQGLQTAVQEAVLRYGELNPGNGLTPAWRH